MTNKSEIEKFRQAYEKHKKTPEGIKAQKRKAAYAKKQMKPGIPKFDGVKIVGKVSSRSK